MLHQGLDRKAARARAVEMLRLVRIPEPQRRRRGIPAPALGRHAAAGDDRDGAGLQPEAADRRRADDRARRHRSRRRSCELMRDLQQRDRRRDRADHARPRRGRRDGAAGRRDVCRPQGRGGAGDARCSAGRCTPTRKGLLRSVPQLGDRASAAAARRTGTCRHCRASPAPAAPAPRCRGEVPRLDRPHRRLRLRAALPACRQHCMRGGARRRCSTRGHGHVAACWHARST